MWCCKNSRENVDVEFIFFHFRSFFLIHVPFISFSLVSFPFMFLSSPSMFLSFPRINVQHAGLWTGKCSWPRERSTNRPSKKAVILWNWLQTMQTTLTTQNENSVFPWCLNFLNQQIRGLLSEKQTQDSSQCVGALFAAKNLLSATLCWLVHKKTLPFFHFATWFHK